MSRTSRRRRALALLALALASGGLAASEVGGSVREAESRVGPSVPVVVARDDLRAGASLHPGELDKSLGIEEVPQRFVPPDSLAAPEEAAGLRTAVPVAAGGYVTLGHLETAGTDTDAAGGLVLAPGERVVEVAVAGGEAVAAAGPGARVDVLVTTGAESGTGRTYLALEDVELLGIRSAGAGLDAGGEVSAGGAVASLRVTLEQAVRLTAAQNFAREIRLLARAPGDGKRAGPTSVDAGEL